MTEDEIAQKIAELRQRLERLADETRKANTAWHATKKELEWYEAVLGGEDVED